MNKSNNFILYNEVYNLYLHLYPILKKFPKSEKFTLEKEIRDTFLELLLILDKFTRQNQKDKLNQVKRISYQFDKAKLLIRLSLDLQFISQNQYIILFDSFEKCGKLIGGLIKKYNI